MTTPMTYFLEVNLALAAFYLFFRLLLHKDTFFKQKRVAFLITYLFTLAFPFVDLMSWLGHQQPIILLVQTLDTTLPEIVITPETTSFNLFELLVWGYGLVAVFLLLRFSRQLIILARLLMRSDRVNHHGVEVVNLPAGQAPFSFMRWIFVNTDSCSSRDLDEIIGHEQAHINQHHSLDVMLAELICILFWINPFAWLLRRSLRENLEYLADSEVLKAGFNTQSYQYHLLRLSSQESTVQMANHFNVIHLKKRIIMMNKQKTSLMGLTKYALSIPLFAFFLLAAQAWGLETLNTVSDELTEITVPSSLVSTPPAPQADQVIVVSKVNVKDVTDEPSAKTNQSKVSNDVISVNDVPADQAKQTSVTQRGKVVWTGVSGNETAQNTKTGSANEGKPLTMAEEMPQFPGGEAALIIFIKENLRYPSVSAQNGIEGRCIIRFVVDKDGNVTNVESLRGLDEACDAEAIRVVKAMPKWKPGRQKGENVPVYYTIPIVFKLQGGSTTPQIASTTLVKIVNGQSTTITNTVVNKDLPLIIVDNKRYQVEGADLKNASETDILKILNLSAGEIESVVVLKGKAAEQLHGKNTDSGVIMITTKKQAQ
jgi:TonB family protein